MRADNKRNRVLFLGGAYAQIPIIKEAKERGYYIITCDYLPGNPGHKLADEYHDVSTTDMQGVLDLARKVRPDLIIAYASDPAAPVASYVSEELGLPGNPYASVRILSEKDLFRDFLTRNGFNAPVTRSFTEAGVLPEMVNDMVFPVMVKPTDSSGSKGVSRVNEASRISEAAAYAFSFSRNQRIIVEEFVDSAGEQLHGDGFVENGELIFSFLGDHHYDTGINPYVPFSTTWPSRTSPETVQKVEREIAALIKKSGFERGPVNLEARVDREGRVFIMEIGPRSGGNFVPQVIRYATGFDMVKASFDVLLGKSIFIPERPNHFAAYYVIHSEYDGELVHLSTKEGLKPYIREFHQYIQPGGKVRSFQGANAAIGILLLTFESREEMESVIENMNIFVDLKIRPDGGGR
jgi:biotin carboxylase